MYSGKQSALELRRRTLGGRAGFQPPEMHDRRQWTAVYVGSPAARMTTTGDGGGWSRRRTGCSRKDTVAPDHAGIGERARPAPL